MANIKSSNFEDQCKMCTKRISKLTLIDKLILFEAAVNLLCILPIIGAPFEDNLPEWSCFFMPFFYTYIGLLNRMVPLGIVTFRYIYVCKYYWVTGAYGASSINRFLVAMLFICPLITTTFIFTER